MSTTRKVYLMLNGALNAVVFLQVRNNQSKTYHNLLFAKLIRRNVGYLCAW